MLLSFSVPEMLPYLQAGVRQAQGENVGAARVKRQTIRRLGPRGRAIIDRAKQAFWTHPYDLHLWWKSRTPQRCAIGTIKGGGRCYPINILHSEVVDGSSHYECFRIDGPQGWRDGDAMLFWSREHGGKDFEEEAYADGFDSARDFVRYFVPNLGDRFDAVLFKW